MPITIVELLIRSKYVHKSKPAINQETYSKECIDKRLAQISFEWKLFVLVKAHYSNIVQERLTQKYVLFVSRVDNPPKLVQLRLYGLYLNERYMKIKNIDHLVKRIKQKAKELDQEILQGMIEGARKKFRAIWRDELDSVLQIILPMLFLIKKNSTFHLLKWLSCEAQHFSKDCKRLLIL